MDALREAVAEIARLHARAQDALRRRCTELYVATAERLLEAGTPGDQIPALVTELVPAYRVVDASVSGLVPNAWSAGLRDQLKAIPYLLVETAFADLACQATAAKVCTALCEARPDAVAPAQWEAVARDATPSYRIPQLHVSISLRPSGTEGQSMTIRLAAARSSPLTKPLPR